MPDWSALFSFTVPPLELVVRGTAMYLGLMVIVRVLLRRDIGAVGVADVLFVVIIADAAQNAMSGEYKSIADGMVLVGTLVVWNALLDYLSFRSPAFSRLMDSPARPLIRNGQLIRANLRREWITRDELMGLLRTHGVEDTAQVKAAYLEANGEISVIKREEKDGANNSRKRTPGAT